MPGNGLCPARLANEVSIYTTNQDGYGELRVPTDSAVQRMGSHSIFPDSASDILGNFVTASRALKEKIPYVDIVHIHSLYMFHTAVSAHYCKNSRPLILSRRMVPSVPLSTKGTDFGKRS